MTVCTREMVADCSALPCAALHCSALLAPPLRQEVKAANGKLAAPGARYVPPGGGRTDLSCQELIPEWAVARLEKGPTVLDYDEEGMQLGGYLADMDVAREAFEGPRSRPAGAPALPGRPEDTVVLVGGATGYIGRFVVKQLVARGYKTYAMARPKSGPGGARSIEDTRKDLAGAELVFCDPVDKDGANIQRVYDELNGKGVKVDAVISCLASRTGGVRDSWEVDYLASKRLLDCARAQGAAHFTLLGAICVQKPLLEFHRAKLALFEYMKTLDDIGWTDVRPTAYFKSLVAPIQIARWGGAYSTFDGGASNPNKAMAEEELADYIIDCFEKPEQQQRALPIGGPGRALDIKQQGEVVFEAMGKEPTFNEAPIGIFDVIIGGLSWLDKTFPGGKDDSFLNGKFEDPAEFAKIGKFYATEPMLAINPETGRYDPGYTPEHGTISLEDWLKKAATQKDGLDDQLEQGAGLASFANLTKWARDAMPKMS